MFRLVLTASLALLVFGARIPSPSCLLGEKILGGENASILEAPYQAAIIYESYFICGGAILSANVVLSAGHCSYDIPSRFKVRAGTDDADLESGQSIEVSRMLRHENYTTLGYNYDISLFFLTSDLNIDGITIAPVSLPSQGQEVAEGTPALITGWGLSTESATYPEYLQKAIIPIFNQTACIESYATVNSLVSDWNICAGLEDGGIDACKGDDGGPLVIDSQLIGIKSFSKGCGVAGFPGVWTRVAFFVDWINENAGL